MQLIKTIRTNVTITVGNAQSGGTITREPKYPYLIEVGILLISGTRPGVDEHMIFQTVSGISLFRNVQLDAFIHDSNVSPVAPRMIINEFVNDEKILPKIELDANVAGADLVFQIITKWSDKPMKKTQKIQVVTQTVALGTIFTEKTFKLEGGYNRVLGMRAHIISGTEKMDIGLTDPSGVILKDPSFHNTLISTTAVPISERMYPLNVVPKDGEYKIVYRETNGVATVGAQSYQFEFILERDA